MKKSIIIIITLTQFYVLNAQDYISHRRIFYNLLKEAQSVTDFKIFIDTSQAYYHDFLIQLSKLNQKSNIRDDIFIADYAKKCNKKSNIDTITMFNIINLNIIDQAAREDYVSYEEMKITDNIVHKELKKIITRKGHLPSIYEVGNYCSKVCLMTILSHQLINIDSCFVFFYPYILKAAKNGDYTPEEMARLIDYYWYNEIITNKDSSELKCYQLYGTQDLYLDKHKKIKIPVRDIAETEELRYKLGMQSLKDELQKDTTIIYDVELFKQKYPIFKHNK